MKFMNFLQLKELFDFNKGNNIYINKRFYICVYSDNNKVSIFDNEILGRSKVIAQIMYDVRIKKFLLFLGDNSATILYEDGFDYDLTDTIDKLEEKLPIELIKALNNMKKERERK